MRQMQLLFYFQLGFAHELFYTVDRSIHAVALGSAHDLDLERESHIPQRAPYHCDCVGVGKLQKLCLRRSDYESAVLYVEIGMSADKRIQAH